MSEYGIPRTQRRRGVRRRVEGEAPLYILAACFILGAATGAFIGNGASIRGETLELGSESIYGAGGYWSLLFSCSKYHLLLLAASTSLLGPVVIPAVFAARGFIFSCTAAALFAAFTDNAILIMLVVLGIPGLLTLPSLFFVGYEGMGLSRGICGGAWRRNRTGAERNLLPGYIASAAALFAAAGLQYSAIPAIARLLM